MAPFVIPIFIAHQGCPHRCVFCNQHRITGRDENTPPLSGREVVERISSCLQWPRKRRRGETQVAFYGGSFTGLPVERQKELLGAVRPFLGQGRVDRIRLSTRPDYVDWSTVAFLREHGVGVVELGVQSMDQRVLAASRRGHTVRQTEEAVMVLRKGGLAVGAQLMIGLPGDTIAGALAGARRLAGLRPDFVRIYPALVIEGSELAALYGRGGYRPLSLARAVALAARLKDIFDRHAIPVVRMGLQPSADLEQGLVAGPYHPAFGELALSRLLFRKARRALAGSGKGRRRLLIAAADESILRGPRNSFLNRLAGLGLLDEVEIVFDPGQPRNTVRLSC